MLRMINFLLCVVVLLFTSLPVLGSPTMRGTIIIDISDGTITGDITLENFERDENSAYLLNHGLNIKELRDSSGVILKYNRLQESPRYESSAYVIPTNDKKSRNYVPSSVSFHYTGKFPVYSNSEKSAKDWKGNIAFNDSGMRADGLQSALFPTFFTFKNDRVHDLVTYDLTVICAACSHIYIAGDKVRSAPKATFTAALPSSPMIVAGKYKISSQQGADIIESNTKEENHFSVGTNWSDVIESTKSYVSCEMVKNRPFVFVELDSLDGYSGWMWASTNTIVSVGNGSTLKPFLRGNNLENHVEDFSFLVHEYTHLCTETLGQGGPLSLLLNESVAEYVSLISIEKVFGQAVLKNKICELQNSISDAFPASRVKNLKNAMMSLDVFSQNYIFGPLLLLQLDRSYGRDFTLKFINSLIEKSKKGIYININLLNSMLSTINKESKKNKEISTSEGNIEEIEVTNIDCNLK